MTVPDSHIFQQQFYWGQTRAQPHGYRPQTWLKFKHNPELGKRRVIIQRKQEGAYSILLTIYEAVRRPKNISEYCGPVFRSFVG